MTWVRLIIFKRTFNRKGKKKSMRGGKKVFYFGRTCLDIVKI